MLDRLQTFFHSTSTPGAKGKERPAQPPPTPAAPPILVRSRHAIPPLMERLATEASRGLERPTEPDRRLRSRAADLREAHGWATERPEVRARLAAYVRESLAGRLRCSAADEAPGGALDQLVHTLLPTEARGPSEREQIIELTAKVARLSEQLERNKARARENNVAALEARTDLEESQRVWRDRHHALSIDNATYRQQLAEISQVLGHFNLPGGDAGQATLRPARAPRPASVHFPSFLQRTEGPRPRPASYHAGDPSAVQYVILPGRVVEADRSATPSEASDASTLSIRAPGRASEDANLPAGAPGAPLVRHGGERPAPVLAAALAVGSAPEA